MASETQQRPRSKRWVRGEVSTAVNSTSSGHKRVWTRPTALADGGTEAPAQLLKRPSQTVASVAARQQGLNARAAQFSGPLLGSAITNHGSAIDSKLRVALQAQEAALSTVPALSSPVSDGFNQHYVRQRPNQLTLKVPQRRAAEAGAPVRPRSPAAASGSRSNGQPDSTRSRSQVAVTPAFAGATHPRDVLQQQMTVRAAALAGRSPQRVHSSSSASATAATPSGRKHSLASGALQQPAVLAGRSARKRAGSKQWVRPELAGAACCAGAGSSAAAGPGSSAPVESTLEQRSRPGTAAAAPARTPGRAYRPQLPAWAMRGSGPRGSFTARFSTPGSCRQGATLRAKQRAATWLRQVGHSGSSGAVVPASAAVAALRHMRKPAHTWHRQAVSASAAAAAAAASGPAAAAAAAVAASGPAAAAAAAAQVVPARPARQTAGHRSPRAGRQPMRGRSGETVRSSTQRPAKLQRIAGHMYRVGGGMGRSRTLQLQPHSLAPAPSTPAQLLQQVSAAKVDRYSVRGRFRRALVRRLSGLPGSPSSVRGSAGTRRKLRMQLGSSPFAARSAGARKRAAVSRLGQKPRAMSAKLPPQIYCTEFCRTGKCKDRLRCKFVHDPSKVAVCPKWLQGRCEAAACPLQHQLRPDLMPVCTFFLQGACSKTDCPYLHVKLETDARVCEAFLRGWCPDSVACRQKHLTPEMVRQLRQQCVLRPGQAARKPKPRKRKRYFEAEAAADTEAAAGLTGAAAAASACPATCTTSSEEDEDANWESASDSEYGEEGLAWGNFVEV